MKKYVNPANTVFVAKQVKRTAQTVTTEDLEIIWRETDKSDTFKRTLLLNQLIRARITEASSFAKGETHPFELYQRIKSLRSDDPCKEILESLYKARIVKLKK